MSRRAFHALLLVVVVGASCLLSPQPDPPGMNIVASATDRAGPVAVVAEPDTVPAGAGVRVDDPATDSYAEGDASDDGGFVVLVPRAEPGDTLSVTYRIWEDGTWRESEARDIVVDAYDPVPGPLADDNRTSPFVPGEYDAGAGVFSAIHVDPPVEGMARVWCDDGCVEPGSRVIVANRSNAQVVEAGYTAGPFETRIRASIGDVLLIFAVRTANEEQSSRVVELIVPAP
jgi:predicted RNA-binding protein with TRAM domain